MQSNTTNTNTSQPLRGSNSQDYVPQKGLINLMGQTEPNLQFFEDFRWFCADFRFFPGNYSISEAQIFAGNRRSLQKPDCPI